MAFSGAPVTGLVVINEKCFAPLHQALMHRGNNFFIVSRKGKGKKKEIANVKATELQCPCRGICTDLTGAWQEHRTTHTAPETELSLSSALSVLKRLCKVSFAASQRWINYLDPFYRQASYYAQY